MAKTSIYLNFEGNTEEAFLFYKSVFKTEFDGEIIRFSDGKPGVMHVSLPTIGEYRIMGTDGDNIVQGNNVYINLEPDTRGETDRLFAALADGGKIEQAMQDSTWGDYFGCLVDKYGICWMFNCSSKE